MKSILRFLATAAVAFSLVSPARAISPDDVLKAQKIIQIVINLSAKYPTATGTLVAPAPLTDRTGAYHLPYTANGELTEWANKAINAQIGSALGAKAGEEAGKAITSRIPGGSLFNGAIKKKGKELGAVTAVGGAEFIKKTSDHSFTGLDDYAVYLHVKHATDSNYAQALATAMAIYPSLEKDYETALKSAYERAARTAAAAKK